jgi:hypothetical protein
VRDQFSQGVGNVKKFVGIRDGVAQYTSTTKSGGVVHLYYCYELLQIVTNCNMLRSVTKCYVMLHVALCYVMLRYIKL